MRSRRLMVLSLLVVGAGLFGLSNPGELEVRQMLCSGSAFVTCPSWSEGVAYCAQNHCDYFGCYPIDDNGSGGQWVACAPM